MVKKKQPCYSINNWKYDFLAIYNFQGLNIQTSVLDRDNIQSLSIKKGQVSKP